MPPTSLTYWGISGYVIFWLITVAAVALFSARAYRLWRYFQLGRRWGSISDIPKRLLASLVHTVGQWCQLKTVSHRDYSGLGHILIAWGFFIFVIDYFIFIIIGAGFGIHETLKENSFYYYLWIVDIASPLVVLAAMWGIIRRYIVRPARLKIEQNAEALVILIAVLIHPITHLLKEATSIALGHFPGDPGSSQPVFSATLSSLFSGNSPSSIQRAGIAFFWVHWIVVLLVLVYIGYSRYLHIIAAPFNILLRTSRPRGILRPVDLEAGEGFGISSIRDFTRKQILECFSCVICGRCQDVCPAYATGKPLNPKKVMQDIKKYLLQEGPKLLGGGKELQEAHPGGVVAGGVIKNDEMQACTTCGACAESCPVCNNPIDIIIELRRKLVYEGIFDRGQQRALQRVAQDYNPWGIRWIHRAANVGIEEARQGEHYDCLYWLGCVAAFDERVREVAQATAKILKAAGLKFAGLGVQEMCCGDFVRRLGDEGLFQELARNNINTLRKYDFNFILTHCPHCLNTLKNEYPDFGEGFKVVHHTQLINDLLRQGKIRLQEFSRGVTEKVLYHDPCYLGRINDIYDAPRQILKTVYGGVDEFERNRACSFCCGAGGGNIWKEEEAGSKISIGRLEEAIEAGPHILAVACPFCFLMLQEAIQFKGSSDDIILRDIAEIIDKYLC